MANEIGKPLIVSNPWMGIRELNNKKLEKAVPIKPAMLTGLTTTMSNMEPAAILKAINSTKLTDYENEQWFHIVNYKGKPSKNDEPTAELFAILLDKTLASPDMSQNWALIGGAGGGFDIEEMAQKLDELKIRDAGKYNLIQKAMGMQMYTPPIPAGATVSATQVKDLVASTGGLENSVVYVTVEGVKYFLSPADGIHPTGPYFSKLDIHGKPDPFSTPIELNPGQPVTLPPGVTGVLGPIVTTTKHKPDNPVQQYYSMTDTDDKFVTKESLFSSGVSTAADKAQDTIIGDHTKDLTKIKLDQITQNNKIKALETSQTAQDARIKKNEDDKADKATTYTKTEVDNSQAAQVTVTDGKLVLKADKADTYTKLDTDDHIDKAVLKAVTDQHTIDQAQDTKIQNILDMGDVKGIYTTVADRDAKLPTPADKDIAFVGAGSPYQLWKFQSGAWTNLGVIQILPQKFKDNVQITAVNAPYDKAESDGRYALKTDSYLKADTYSKTEADNKFADKTTQQAKDTAQDGNIATLEASQTTQDGKITALETAGTAATKDITNIKADQSAQDVLIKQNADDVKNIKITHTIQ